MPTSGQDLLPELMNAYEKQTPRSKALHDRARSVLLEQLGPDERETLTQEWKSEMGL